MDELIGVKGTSRTIAGNFYYSQQKPISGTKSTKSNEKRLSNWCQLNCDNGYLLIYGLCKTRPIIILPKINKVTRQTHDREFFCLEYGEEPDRFNIFLTIIDKSDADDWEFALCELTGQTPPSRRRTKTDAKRTIKTNRVPRTASTPSAPEGFKLEANTSVQGLDESPPPIDIDFTEETDVEEDCDPPPTRPIDQNEHCNTLVQQTSPRDGQKFPEESHIGEVVGYDKVSPSPGNSPNNRISYKIDEEAGIVLEETTRKLHEMKEQQQQQQQLRQEPGEGQDCSSEPFDELKSTESLAMLHERANQCTHIEFEYSQEKLSIAIDKEDFLNTTHTSDIFASYMGSLYVKSCPEGLQSKLFIGTRILQVNNQEPVSADKAIDYIVSSASKTVNLLVQLFPLGIRVRLRVPSLAALGIKLHGNEITDHGDGVMGKIAECKKCINTTLSTSHRSTEERLSIIYVGDRHVPYDASTDEVKDMLDSAINKGDGYLVLQLQPSEFCQAIAPDALQRRIVQEEDALLHPTPMRRPSQTLNIIKSLKSNPPY